MHDFLGFQQEQLSAASAFELFPVAFKNIFIHVESPQFKNGVQVINLCCMLKIKPLGFSRRMD